MSDNKDDDEFLAADEFDADMDFDEDLPLDEDLGDLSEFTEGDNLIEDDWDDEEIASSDEEDDTPKKKKKGLSFNTIVIIGSVVFGVIFMLFYLSKPPEVTEMQDGPDFVSGLTNVGQVANPVNQPIDIPSAQPESNEPVVQPTGFLKNPEQLDPKDIAPQPTDAIDEGPIVFGDDFVPPMPTPLPVDGSPLDTGGETDNAPTLTPLPELTAPVQPEPRDIPDALPVVDVATPTSLPEIDNVETSLDQEKQQVQELQSLLTENDRMINNLKFQIENMQKQHVKVQEEKSERILDLEREIRELQSQLETSATQVIAKPVIQTPKKAPTKTVKKAAKPKPAPKIIELRAATPGKAWVSQAGSNEMRVVTPGDKVSGIGVVESITFTDNIWVVQGSKGKITQ